MSSWFYELLNEQFGPATEQEIRELIELGSLSETDRLCAVDSDHWISVAEFLAAAGDSEFATELSDLNFEFAESGDVSSTASRTPSASSTQILAEESTPANLYFCQILGQTLGPMDLQDLIPMFEGELSPSDLVRCGENGSWGPAKTFAELIPFLQPPQGSDHGVSPCPGAENASVTLPVEKTQNAAPTTQKRSTTGESIKGTRPGRGSRPKGQKKEDALIDQLLTDVLLSGNDQPSRPSSQRMPETRTPLEPDSQSIVSEPAAVAEAPSPGFASKVSAGLSTTTMPARPQAKSAAKSRFSDGEFRQKVTKTVAGIALLGITVWALMTFRIPGFPVSSAVRSQYVSRMKEVYTELAALDPKASDAGLERYRKIIASEFGGYLTELRKADSDDDASVRCAVALDEFLKFSEEEFRDKSDLEKHLGPLKRSLDRLN